MKLYLVQMRSRDGAERFYKLGITHEPDTMHRFTKHGVEADRIQNLEMSKFERVKAAILGHKFQHPYEIQIIHEVHFATEEFARSCEGALLSAVKPQMHVPRIKFPGHTECFSADAVQLRVLIEIMDHTASGAA